MKTVTCVTETFILIEDDGKLLKQYLHIYAGALLYVY